MPGEQTKERRKREIRNVPKQKFIGECVCGNPVTVEEMDDEEKTICCKRKGCETSWVSQLGCTCQLWLTHKLCSIIFYAQASQVSSEGFQGGFASCASIVGRGQQETSAGERFDVAGEAIFEQYDVIFLYLEGYSHDQLVSSAVETLGKNSTLYGKFKS